MKYGDGGGKYGDVTEAVLRATQADGVIVMVVAGSRGSGCSVMVDPKSVPDLVKTLRGLADALESDWKAELAE